jgi:NAD(P)H-dependent flavin oxidoreductase YrpB (nitropropane dioxygenase family)
MKLTKPLLPLVVINAVGTRFMCTKESEIHDTIKRAIVESDERNTVHIFRTLRNTARVFK